MTHFPLHCTFTLPQLLCTDKKIGFQDTHGQNVLSNKTEALTKSMNMNIWAIGTLNQLIIEVLILKLNFQKNKVVSVKCPFLLVAPWYSQFVLTLAFGRAVLYGNVALSFVVV